MACSSLDAWCRWAQRGIALLRARATTTLTGSTLWPQHCAHLGGRLDLVDDLRPPPRDRAAHWHHHLARPPLGVPDQGRSQALAGGCESMSTSTTTWTSMPEASNTATPLHPSLASTASTSTHGHPVPSRCISHFKAHHIHPCSSCCAPLAKMTKSMMRIKIAPTRPSTQATPPQSRLGHCIK